MTGAVTLGIDAPAVGKDGGDAVTQGVQLVAQGIAMGASLVDVLLGFLDQPASGVVGIAEAGMAVLGRDQASQGIVAVGTDVLAGAAGEADGLFEEPPEGRARTACGCAGWAGRGCFR